MVKTALPIPSISCPELEWLEPRLLLNAGALSSQQEADLLTGLAEWSSWAGTQLEAEPLLQQLMPIVGVSLSDALDAGDALTTHLHDAVQAGMGSTDTIEELAAYLDRLDGTVVGGLAAQYDNVVAYSVSGATVSIGLRLSVRGEQLAAVDLGAAAEAIGLTYDVAPEVPLTGEMRFDLSFGLAGGSFFLDSSRLEFTAAVDAQGVGFPAQFRLADLQVVGGSLDLHAGASVEFAEIDVGGVTASNMQAFSVAVAGEARADGALPLQGNPGEIVLWEAPELVVMGTDLLAGGAAHVDVAFGAAEDRLVELDQQVRAAVSGGLNGLVDWLRRVGEAGPLGKSIPEIGTSLGEVLALDEAVASRLAGPVGDYLDGTDVVTLDSLLAELDSLAGSSGGVTLTRLGTSDSLAEGISVAVHVDRTATVELEAFAAQEDVPLLLDAPVEVALHVQADLSFRFGVDFSAWPSASEAFYVEFNEDPQIQAMIADSPLMALGRVGLLEVWVQGGSAQMTANVAIPGIAGTPQRRTLGELRSEPADGLATGNGTLAISLPVGFAPGREVSGVLGGETPTFLITDDHVFDGTAAGLMKEGTAVLEDFRALAAGELLAALTQIGEWMAALQGSPDAATVVPLTQDLAVAEVADHAAAYQANVAELLSQEVTRDSGLTATQPAFATVQGLVDQLGGRVTGLQYDAGSRELVLALSYAEAQGEQTAAFRYEEQLGLLRDVTSESAVRVTPQISHSLELGIVLEPVGSGFQLTRGMLLGELNGGAGVLIDEAGPGDPELADLRITLRSGAAFEVTLDGAQTVGDVLDRLAAAAPPDPVNPPQKLFAADIHEDGHRLVMTDKSRGDATFRIQGANGSLAGFGLGILGEFVEEAFEVEQDPAEEDAVMDGKPLHGQTLGDYVFLRNVDLAATLDLQADDVDAEAAIGFVGVTVTDGTASGAVTERHEFAGRATLHERFTALEGSAPPTRVGTLDLNLPVALARPMAGVSAVEASAVIHAGDVTNLPAATITTHNLDDVLLLESVSRGTILSAMGAASDFVADAESLDSIAELDLGLFAIGVVEQVDLAEAFEAFVAGLSAQGIADLQSLEAVLEQQLGLPAGDNPEVTVLLDAGGAALPIELDLEHQADGNLPLSMDITELGLSAANRLQDVAASDPVGVEAAGTLGLVLGIDLSGEPAGFLYDTTSIAYEAHAQDDSVGFDTSLGPMDVSVTGGQVRLSRSEADASNPATYTVTLTDPDADDRHALSATVGESDVAVAVEGWAEASLPMSYLTNGSDTLTFAWDLSLPAEPTVEAAQFFFDTAPSQPAGTRRTSRR